MNANLSHEDLFFEAKSMFDNGNSFSEIESLFLQNGIDENRVKEIIKKVVEYKNKKRLSIGFKLLLIGAAFLVSSCMLTIATDYSNENFTFILYGLTSIGASIVIGGFVLIFG